MGRVQGQVDHVAVTHATFGNDVVGKALHFGPAPLEHGDFHATLLIEVHVQRRLCQVAVFVEIASKALRQFAGSRTSPRPSPNCWRVTAPRQG
jgi:hypothetical protein